MPFDYQATVKITEGAMSTWLAQSVTGDITEVPFIKTETAKLFRAAGIHTTWQLFGKFLALRSETIGSQALMDAFYDWLESIGVNAGRANITVLVAEKVNLATGGGLYSAAELMEAQQARDSAKAGGSATSDAPVTPPAEEGGWCTIA